MTTHKIRLLGIAPYEGLKILMQQIADSFPEIELVSYVGNLTQAISILENLNLDDFDAIISRGGTAELIREHFNLPVIDIKLTAYDLLIALKLSESYTQQHAIVGYSSITENLKQLCNLLQYNIDIFTIDSEERLSEILSQLKFQGYKMVLGDMITCDAAKKMGLNALLITSGSESTKSAFEYAINTCSINKELLSKYSLLKHAISELDSHIALFQQNGSLIYSSIPTTIYNSLSNYFNKKVLSAFTERFSSFKNIQNALYSIEGKTIILDDQTYYAFYVTQSKTPLASGKYGLSFSDRSEIENLFYSDPAYFIENDPSLSKTLDSYAQSTRPVTILGEYGSGKNQAAQWLYLKEKNKTFSFITIDFCQLTEKSWGYLTNHYNSPLNENNNTLYFKNIDRISENKCRSLLSLIIDTKLHERNRLIFSFTENQNTFPPIIKEFITGISCVTLSLPPLRERKSDLSSLISLKLNSINLELAKEIIGVESNALTYLNNYDWPQNYLQFQRVLYELAVITNTAYISTDSVIKILDKEKRTFPTNPKPVSTLNVSFDYNRTLEEMTIDIVKHVVTLCNGNNTLAAKKLGIGRSTLWRYLSKINN